MLLTETFMCSDTCPCPKEAEVKYSELYAKPEGKKRFETVKRFMESDTAAASKEDFSKLVFSSSGTTFK